MLDKLSDESDAASQQESLHTESSIKDIQKLLEPQLHPDFDGETCLSCGEDMPKQRLSAGRIRCTHCESKLEVKSKFFRR